MSISIGHRAIFTAFGHRTSVARHVPVPEVRGQAETSAPGVAGELKCSPWEGLYLEQAAPPVDAGQGAGANRELDAFLAGLMYGE